MYKEAIRLTVVSRIAFLYTKVHQCDLAKAVDLVLSTIATLEEFRSDSSWNHLYSYTQEVTTVKNIPITIQNRKRQKRMPNRFDDSFNT